MQRKIYFVQKVDFVPELNVDWESPVWQSAETAEVDYFYPESSNHHPITRVRLLYGATGFHGIFQVQDQYVRCLHTGYLEEVWKDACVEFFVRPRPTAGYFNFEMNCGGGLLCYYIVDPTLVGDGFVDFIKLPKEDGSQVKICTTLPGITEPEVASQVTWALQFFIPMTLLEKYVGPLGAAAGQEWRANFNKCAENNSHPHWATWNPLTEQNFHSPDEFGVLRFAG